MVHGGHGVRKTLEVSGSETAFRCNSLEAGNPSPDHLLRYRGSIMKKKVYCKFFKIAFSVSAVFTLIGSVVVAYETYKAFTQTGPMEAAGSMVGLGVMSIPFVIVPYAVTKVFWMSLQEVR